MAGEFLAILLLEWPGFLAGIGGSVIIDLQQIIMALCGGILIGLSVTIMLIAMGRVTGISGITYNFVTRKTNDWIWRGFFLLGLIVGGFVLRLVYPTTLESTLDFGVAQIAIAGLLVGFGTVLGNGCTSGHGVCGISRFSLRSITATITFMAFGIVTVAAMRFLFFGGAL
jgi:uncharacterized membrane protein YedE/YeeE